MMHFMRTTIAILAIACLGMACSGGSSPNSSDVDPNGPIVIDDGQASINIPDSVIDAVGVENKDVSVTVSEMTSRTIQGANGIDLTKFEEGYSIDVGSIVYAVRVELNAMGETPLPDVIEGNADDKIQLNLDITPYIDELNSLISDDKAILVYMKWPDGTDFHWELIPYDVSSDNPNDLILTLSALPKLSEIMVLVGQKPALYFDQADPNIKQLASQKTSKQAVIISGASPWTKPWVIICDTNIRVQEGTDRSFCEPEKLGRMIISLNRISDFYRDIADGGGKWQAQIGGTLSGRQVLINRNRYRLATGLESFDDIHQSVQFNLVLVGDYDAPYRTPYYINALGDERIDNQPYKRSRFVVQADEILSEDRCDVESSIAGGFALSVILNNVLPNARIFNYDWLRMSSMAYNRLYYLETMCGKNNSFAESAQKNAGYVLESLYSLSGGIKIPFFHHTIMAIKGADRGIYDFYKRMSNYVGIVGPGLYEMVGYSLMSADFDKSLILQFAPPVGDMNPIDMMFKGMYVKAAYEMYGNDYVECDGQFHQFTSDKHILLSGDARPVSTKCHGLRFAGFERAVDEGVRCFDLSFNDAKTDSQYDSSNLAMMLDGKVHPVFYRLDEQDSIRIPVAPDASDSQDFDIFVFDTDMTRNESEKRAYVIDITPLGEDECGDEVGFLPAAQLPQIEFRGKFMGGGAVGGTGMYDTCAIGFVDKLAPVITAQIHNQPRNTTVEYHWDVEGGELIGDPGNAGIFIGIEPQCGGFAVSATLRIEIKDAHGNVIESASDSVSRTYSECVCNEFVPIQQCTGSGMVCLPEPPRS